MHARLRFATALALVCAGAFSASALASAGLPHGRYYCRYDDQTTMGVITITSAGGYRYNSGKGGTYKLSGSSLTFLSGPMKGVYKHGKFVRKPSETYLQLFDGKSYGHALTDAICLKER